MSVTNTRPDAGPSPTTRRTRPAAAAIVATDLVKTYGRAGTAASVRALDGVSLSVPAGTVFGLLGPNGAGKSTTVKILTTLSSADSGQAVVGGTDVARDPAAVRRAIGYVPQKPCYDPMGTGRENLVLQGRIHGLSRSRSRARADQLLAKFTLSEAADRLAGKWSGGMQRKLDVALGLVHQPSILFLDEPTTGLDPQARAQMWAEITALAVDEGLTILLTTHYLEEADQLAGQLVVIDRGRVVVQGSPEELKSRLDGDTVTFEVAAVPGAPDVSVVQRVLAEQGVGQVSMDGAVVRARVGQGAARLPRLLAAVDAAGIELAAVTVARPSLDDVYLHYTGRSFTVAGASADADAEVA